MATFSINFLNKNFIKCLLFFSLIIICPNASFSDINISKIKNKVSVLNIHGKRFFLNENNNIRSGDYLSTREKPATIVFKDNSKMCFSSNSSLKILKKKDRMDFEFKKGSILFSINKKSKNNYNLDFFSYNLQNIKDVIILSKKNNLRIINFKKNQDVFYKDHVNKINLPSFTILELSKNGKVFRKTKFSQNNNSFKEYFEDCMIYSPKSYNIEKKNTKLQYGCVSKNGKLVCSRKYK